MRRFSAILLAVVFSAGVLSSFRFAGAAEEAKIKALIVDGQNNHQWKVTTPIIKAALESSGMFTVDVATSPAKGQKMDDFKPQFSNYGVVVSNYNGDDWSDATKKAFEEYVSNGGGFVSVHAADNSFPKWPEYNKMIAVGGWGGRNSSFGPMLRWRDGKVEKDATGGAGTHGKFFSFVVEIRDTEQPDHQGFASEVSAGTRLTVSNSLRPRRERDRVGNRRLRIRRTRTSRC